MDLVGLGPLMKRTSGCPRIALALIDGPVVIDHPDLVGAGVVEIPGDLRGICSRASSQACVHGTFVAGILMAQRSSAAPGICPDCALLLRPIFAEIDSGPGRMPSATATQLAAAINDSIDAGARVINISAAIGGSSTKEERVLGDSLDRALRCGVITVAAAGNQGVVASSAITRHPWVIPVAACDLRGRPMNQSNLGSSIGRSGLRAPGDGITSVGSKGAPMTLGGTSAAAPFVTGTIALLWSEFPTATAAQVKFAVTQAQGLRRGIVPPLLNAWTAYEALARARGRG